MKYLFTNIQKQKNMLKSSLLFRKTTTSRVNNSRILRIKNAKFSGYCFYMNLNIWWDFQICISVPLREKCNRPKYNLWALRKNDSSTPKNVAQNTNEHICDYLRLLDFEELLEKPHYRKTIVMNILHACNFIKKWL